MSAFQPQMIVCYEKHDTRYLDASTPEKWAASALAILTERWEQGYWYHDPDDDGLGQSEWADQRREQYRQALALSQEQIDALPDEARRIVLELRTRAKRERPQDKRHRTWWERAKRVVEEQDLSFGTRGRMPLAWELLQERSDHEYEGVELVDVEAPPAAKR